MQFSVQFPEVDRAQRIKHLMAQPEWAALVEELDLRCLKLQIQVFNNDEALSDFRLGKVTGQHAAFKCITQNLAKEMQIRIDKANKESEGSANSGEQKNPHRCRGGRSTDRAEPSNR